jgi:hypothetical protein
MTIGRRRLSWCSWVRWVSLELSDEGALVRACRIVGLARLAVRDLRATAIVLWIRSEVPLTTVRSLAARHASLATTDRSARIARNDLAGAAAQVDIHISYTRQRRSDR